MTFYFTARYRVTITKKGEKHMRLLVSFFMVCLLSCPAWAAFKGPSVAQKEFISATAALEAPEGATCVLTGNIIEHINKDRYTFKDDSGSIVVNIHPHVFGSLDVTPDNVVKITGEIRGKREKKSPDAHVGIRYIEIIK